MWHALVHGCFILNLSPFNGNGSNNGNINNDTNPGESRL